MAEYMDREEYCKKYCLSKNKRCDKEDCFIWRTPIAVIPLTAHGWWENDNPSLVELVEAKNNGYVKMADIEKACGANIRW